MTSLRCFWLGCLALFGAGGHASAGHDFGKVADASGRMEMWIRGCWSELPAGGMAPINVRIRNHGDRTQTWTLTTRGAQGYGFDSSVSSAHYLTVDGKAERTFQLLAPLPWQPLAERHHYFQANLEVTVAGPGIAGERREQYSHISSSNGIKSVAMSEALHARSWQSLVNYLSSSFEILGGSFDPGDLPADWRGYSGLDLLWISEDEWLAKVPPEAREALLQWAAAGGTLAIAEREGQSQGSLRSLVGDEGRYGLGRIRFGPWDGKELSADNAAKALVRQNLTGGVDPQLRALTGDHARRFGFIMTAVCVFAIVVGPVNLFVWARGTKRYRLLFTTPVISVAASGVLIALILLQDGIGGAGARMTVVHLLPEAKQRLVVQEQVARTGLLVSREWKSHHDLQVRPLMGRPSPGGTFSGQYHINGGSYSGDWFASRRIQAHLLQSMQPTRARIEIIQVEGSPPAVLSHVDEVLNDFYYVAPDGQYWKAATVRAGERLDLSPGTRWDFVQWRERIGMTKDEGRMQQLLRNAWERPGYFYAVAADPDASAMATLDSIRWQTIHTLFLGPVSGQQP